MIKVENIDVWGFEHATRGARNALNSWDKSDSGWHWDTIEDRYDEFIIGEKDIALMRRLYKAGPSHRKYLRQIFVSMDIVAPDYWFKEFSTYKIGTVENSTSTMHKIAAKEFTWDDFSLEHIIDEPFPIDNEWVSSYKDEMTGTIKALNAARTRYLETKDKIYWWQMIQMLPMSYNYRRTVTMNYENVVNMIHQRSNHKLQEWRDFTDILRKLPYVKEIMDGMETE